MAELVKLFVNHRAATLNTVGLMLTIVGAVLVFRYGIALQVDTGGYEFLYGDRKPEQVELERWCKWLSGLGLVYVLLGTFYQVMANWL